VAPVNPSVRISTLRMFLAAPVLLVACADFAPAGEETAEPPAALEGQYRTALVDAPCPGEGDDSASARRAIAHVRALAGLPMPRCDRAASSAAHAHCAYVEANGGTLTHVQQPGRPGFTGRTHEDRLAAVAFADSPGGEVMATITGAESITGPRGYLNSVYHRALLLRAETISFGYGATASCSTVDLGRVRDLRTVADVIVAWPPNGARSVPSTFYASSEAPNPMPGSTAVGAPVSLISSVALVRVTASLIGPDGEVRTTLLTHENDKNRLVRPGEAHLIPVAPLSADTKYRARFVVTRAGRPAPVTIETTFTTISR